MSKSKRRIAELEAELRRAKGYVIEFGQEVLRERAQRLYLEDVLSSLIIELDNMGYEVSIPPKEN